MTRLPHNPEPKLLPNAGESANGFWPFWFVLPLYPYGKRRTIRRELLPDLIWSFEQIQGILYTVVPIRMTIVKLKMGGLLVYAPIAPTAECLQLIRELEARHGEVRYIILPTTSGLEHKVFAGPFAQKFPRAQVFVADHQWSFPINLPLSWLGFPAQRTHILPLDSSSAPFGDEFDYAALHIDFGRGSFDEIALFHKCSKTLLVTDIVLSIPVEPPEIVQVDPYPLLFHARDSALEPIVDTPSNRLKGWQRIALFSMYFRPSAIKVPSIKQVIAESFQAPDRSKKAYFGLYPFQWDQDWQTSFKALQGNDRPFVAPILQILILDHAPKKVLSWASKLTKWDFNRIIPCHFEPMLKTNPQELQQSFDFLSEHPINNPSHEALPNSDTQFIQDLEKILDKLKITSSASSKNQ